MAEGACDRIFLRDYVREIEIGVLEEERGVTQRLAFDIELEVSAAVRTDDVAEVVSYVALVEAVDEVAAGPRLQLLETFAERVAERCLTSPQAVRAHIRIAKLDRLEGDASFGVAITRPAG